MSKEKKITSDDVFAWWDSASEAERESFTEALWQEIGKDAAYWMLVDAVGGEDELKRMIDERLRCRGLS